MWNDLHSNDFRSDLKAGRAQDKATTWPQWESLKSLLLLWGSSTLPGSQHRQPRAREAAQGRCSSLRLRRCDMASSFDLWAKKKPAFLIVVLPLDRRKSNIFHRLLEVQLATQVRNAINEFKKPPALILYFLLRESLDLLVQISVDRAI